VFAIVPDLSAMNPGTYLNAQHVPYVGWAFDNTYCSRKPTTKLYGFGYSGCQVPDDPPYVGNGFLAAYDYVSHKTAKAHPSAVLFSGDNASGKNTTRIQASAAQGAGFKVVYAKGTLPDVATDYTPYIQEWLTAAGGHQPDYIECLASVQCLPIWDGLQAAGFTGTYNTPLYTDILLKALAGTTARSYFDVDPNPGLTQMEHDLDAVAPATKVTTSNAAAYFSADMFVQAVKKVVAKSGTKGLTPEAVQVALARQTWQIKGLVGPYTYPASTVIGSPSCVGAVLDEDGTAWKTIEPYACSAKTFTLDPKFQG
jgi:ABC-type branched-subunit amino acid transport system substrate-binding protein